MAGRRFFSVRKSDHLRIGSNGWLRQGDDPEIAWGASYVYPMSHEEPYKNRYRGFIEPQKNKADIEGKERRDTKRYKLDQSNKTSLTLLWSSGGAEEHKCATPNPSTSTSSVLPGSKSESSSRKPANAAQQKTKRGDSDPSRSFTSTNSQKLPTEASIQFTGASNANAEAGPSVQRSAAAALILKDEVLKRSQSRRTDHGLAAAGSQSPNPPTASKLNRKVRIDIRYNRKRDIEARDTFHSEDDPTPIPTIKNLSLECLQLIVLQVTPDPLAAPVKRYQKAVYIFVRVCRRWRDAAVKTRSLWSHLANGYTPGMFEACIRRSVGHHITIDFDGVLEYPINVQAAYDRFVNKIIPRRLNWRSVRFTDIPPTWSSALTVDRALNGPKPRLFPVTITTIHSITITRLHPLRFETPTLRHLILTGFIPDLTDVSTFSTLQKLCVRHPKGLSSSSLVVLLARNSNILQLELEEVRLLLGHLFRQPNTFGLSKLARFKLHLLENKTAEMAQIFTRLRAPKCKGLDLSIDMDNLNELELTFKNFKDCVESFLVQPGTWLSRWMILDGGKMRSGYHWLKSAAEGALNKSIFYWRLQGSPARGIRNLIAEIRLHADHLPTKKLISSWVEDVKLYCEKEGVRTTLLERIVLVEDEEGESFRSFRRNALQTRAHNADAAAPMDIWDTRLRY
ncbi:hypothetical protein FRB90_012313 [Tulasnella sp. 427]|nr:hypothetical protein FRB90_012313 [Tulasnella sp. 427]